MGPQRGGGGWAGGSAFMQLKHEDLPESHRERPRGVFQLLLEGLYVVAVDMGIPQDMHKVPRLQAAGVCYEVCEEGVAGNVEGDPQAQIA